MELHLHRGAKLLSFVVIQSSPDSPRGGDYFESIRDGGINTFFSIKQKQVLYLLFPSLFILFYEHSINIIQYFFIIVKSFYHLKNIFLLFFNLVYILYNIFL
jgi:hypothetical protein